MTSPRAPSALGQAPAHSQSSVPMFSSPRGMTNSRSALQVSATPLRSYVADATDVSSNGEPQVPLRLTEGLPDPESIETQKKAYAQGLQIQSSEAESMMEQQLKAQVAHIWSQANAEKHTYNVELDQQKGQKILGLTAQFNQQKMQLREAAQTQKVLLEQQSSALTLEYQSRKAHQDLLMSHHEAQKRHYAEQVKAHEAQKRSAELAEQAQKHVDSQQAKVNQMTMEYHAQKQQTNLSTARPQFSAPPVRGAVGVGNSVTVPATTYAAPSMFAAPHAASSTTTTGPYAGSYGGGSYAAATSPFPITASHMQAPLPPPPPARGMPTTTSASRIYPASYPIGTNPVM